jgi:hypothetical protein
MGSAAPAPSASPLSGLMPQAGPSGDMSDVIGQIRTISQQIDALGMASPAIAPIAAQIKTLLKQAIVSAAQQASVQTASSEAVPMGG